MTVRIYVCILAALTCGAVSPLAAQGQGTDTTPAPPVPPVQPVTPVPIIRTFQGGGIALDFDDADLRTVITAIAQAGRIDFTQNDLPNKKVSLHAHLTPGRSGAIALLRRVVQANGLYMIERGGVLLISSVPPLPDNNANIVADTQLFVYRLKHANATRLADVLQAIFNGTTVPRSNTGINRQTLSQANQGSRIGGGGGFGNQGGFGNLGGGNQQGGGGGQGGARAGAARSYINIIPEESTNSLLVRADSTDWNVVKQAIDAVDIRPLQVLIEVMIVEVQRNQDLNLGIGFNGSNQRTFNGRTIGTGHLPVDTSSSNFIANFTRYGGVDMNVAISALRTRGDVRILSRPIIFAENNVASHLLVGSQQPFIQSSTTQPTVSTTQNQVVQYRDVGTLLDILPTINSDGYVDLQLQQQISAATSQVQFGAPVISNREASASLFVRDGQTIVVGGLTDTQDQKTRTGIPGLSSIPFIGGLFGSTQTTSTRTELFLFLTPHIVRADDDIDRIKDAISKRSKLMQDVPATPYINPGSSAAPSDSAPSPVKTIQLPKHP